MPALGAAVNKPDVTGATVVLARFVGACTDGGAGLVTLRAANWRRVRLVPVLYWYRAATSQRTKSSAVVPGCVF